MGVGGTPEFKVTCEIKGVNGRYFDAKFHIPTRHMRVESALRKISKKEVSRGRIDAYFRYEVLDSDRIDEHLKEKINFMLEDMKQIAESEGADLQVGAGDILSIMKYVSESGASDEEQWELIESAYVEATQNALKAFSNMRQKEGFSIASELEEILKKAVESMRVIEERAPEISSLYKDKLYDRVKKLLDGHKVDEIVLLNEVSVMADKTDVREEIFRFFEHAERFESLLNSSTVGKKLDFLIQEMNREVNTIGSKTQDVDISNTVIDIKGYVEQLREQIQNVE